MAVVVSGTSILNFVWDLVAVCFPIIVVVVVPFIILLRLMKSVVRGGNQMKVLDVCLKSHARE